MGGKSREVVRGKYDMALAERNSPTKVRAFRRGSALRLSLVTIFVAAAVLIVTAATPEIAAASQTDWSAPLTVDFHHEITSVSCAIPSFCVAGDNVGSVMTYNGSSWSEPMNISEAHTCRFGVQQPAERVVSKLTLLHRR
jgi:hypothetical protein